MVLVDTKGRVLIPSELRERLGLRPGDEVEFRVDDGNLVLEPRLNPEQIIARMDELVDGIDDDECTRGRYAELDPQSKAQIDSITRQAQQHDSDSADE